MPRGPSRPGDRFRRLISLISCTWDVHRPVPRVSTGAHPRRMRCGIRWARGRHAAICIFQWHRSATIIGGRRREEAESRRLPSPPVLVSEPGPAGIMPIPGTFMRRRHAVTPTRIGKRRRRARAIASALRRSFAHRDARPCGSFRRAFTALPSNAPSSLTRHPRIRTRTADARPNCMTLTGIARPQPGGEPGRIVVAFRLKARRRWASAPPRGLRPLHHPAPGGPCIHSGQPSRF